MYQAWEHIEPSMPFIPNWHIEAICDHLQAVTEGEIRNLIINIPPGHAKSTLVSVAWPAWMWVREPGFRGIYSSYALELAVRDNVRCRDLLLSEWYKETFSPSWSFKGDQNVKGYFENTEKGFRLAVSVGARATGFRGDVIVCDDPLNAREGSSEAALNECIYWWDQAMSSRLRDPRKGAKVIIMQRLHERDLTGHCLEKGGYVHLSLPSEFEPSERCETPIWSDPREEPGELLFPALFTPEVLEQAKQDLGSAGYAAQHGQKPAPAEGLIFNPSWWQYWTAEDLPEEFDEVIQSWDLAFKDLKTSDFVAGGVWGRKGSQIWLLDFVNARLSFTKTCEAIIAMSQKWPTATRKLVEDKANGPAVVDSLKGKVGGLVLVNPEGGKVARAQASQPLVEAGDVFLPQPSIRPDIGVFIHQAQHFPLGANDDLVDMFTQAVLKLLVKVRKKLKIVAA